MHSDIHPFPATVAETLPGPLPTVSPTSEGCGLAHSRPKYPHRRVFVLASWRSAHAWISAAYPSGLDAARPDLTAEFPELAANIDALELAAQQEASTYQNEPNATPSAFQAALARWERAFMDGLQALAYAQPAATGHQLEMEVSHA
jgi:hypothetical protein